MGPCRCGRWRGLPLQQEGTLPPLLSALPVASLLSWLQGHLCMGTHSPAGTMGPLALPHAPFPRAVPTLGHGTPAPCFRYLLKQLCSPGCLLPAVCLSVGLSLRAEKDSGSQFPPSAPPRFHPRTPRLARAALPRLCSCHQGSVPPACAPRGRLEMSWHLCHGPRSCSWGQVRGWPSLSTGFL